MSGEPQAQVEHRLEATRLRSWIAACLTAVGVRLRDARAVADALVQTSLWGIDSHGISRLPHYIVRLRNGSINPCARPCFERTGAATGRLNGHDGLGILVARAAMGAAMRLARSAGAGIIGISNSSHCGALGLYVRRAAAAGQIGIALTHSDSLVIPFGGTKPFFGTNPLAVAVPAPDRRRPLCVDMATSAAPWNRVLESRRTGRPLPPGVAVDAAGHQTQDPNEAVALRPAADHKGYALAFLIDMLSGPLNQMNCGPWITPMYSRLQERRGLGGLMIAIEPKRFGGHAALIAGVTMAVMQVKQDHGSLAPGDPEYRRETERRVHGIPIDRTLLEELNDCGRLVGVGELHSPHTSARRPGHVLSAHS